jgi:hypothetical protein
MDRLLTRTAPESSADEYHEVCERVRSLLANFRR